MVARLSHTIDHAAVARVAKGPEVVAELVEARGKLARETRRIAPHGPTNQYSESIVEGPMETDGGNVATSYGSSDWAAHIVEFGSVTSPAYRCLHRAAGALGYRVTD